MFARELQMLQRVPQDHNSLTCAMIPIDNRQRQRKKPNDQSIASKRDRIAVPS